MKRLTCVLSSLVLAVGLCVLPTRALAGPWTPAPGHGYAKLWLKWLPGFGYHDAKGDLIDYGKYNEVFLNGYGEVGLLPKLGATLHFPFAQFFSLEDTRTGDTERHFTIGDPALGLRYQALSLGRFAASLEGFVRSPLAPAGKQQPMYEKRDTEVTDPDTGMKTTFKRQIGDLRIGTGVFDLYAGAAVGYGFDRMYLAGSGGYMVRTGGYDDAINWTAEIGGRYSERWQGRCRMSGVNPLTNGTAPRGNSPSGIGNSTRYLGFSIETEYQFKPRWFAGFGLQGGAGLLARQTGGPVIDLYVATNW